MMSPVDGPAGRLASGALLFGTALFAALAGCEGKQGEPFMPTTPGHIDSTKVEGSEFGHWTAKEDPYYVVKPVFIPAGKTLRIDPGVLVIFTRKGLDLTVRGSLIADGKPESLITFRPNSNRGLPASPGDFAGLKFTSGSTGEFDYTRILYAETGLTASDAGLRIRHCTITNHSATGLELTRCDAELVDDLIANNGKHGIKLAECDPPIHVVTLTHCRVGNNRGSGIWAVDSSVRAERSDFETNGTETTPAQAAISAGVHFEGLPGVELPVFRRCNIEFNSPCDVRNLMPPGIIVDADSNYWGDITTSQMNYLSDPDPFPVPVPDPSICTGNVSRICDVLDSLQIGPAGVRFCYWLATPVPNFAPGVPPRTLSAPAPRFRSG